MNPVVNGVLTFGTVGVSIRGVTFLPRSGINGNDTLHSDISGEKYISSLFFGEVELMETPRCVAFYLHGSRVTFLRRSGINGNLTF